MAKKEEIEKKLNEMLVGVASFAEVCDPQPTHHVVVFWDSKSDLIEAGPQ